MTFLREETNIAILDEHLTIPLEMVAAHDFLFDRKNGWKVELYKILFF